MELKYAWLKQHEGFSIEEHFAPFAPDTVCLKYEGEVLNRYIAANPLLTEDFLKGEIVQFAKINCMARETTQILK